MEQSAIKKIYELIGNIPVTIENAELIEEIKIDLQKEDYTSALQKIEKLGPKKENDEEYEDEEESEKENFRISLGEYWKERATFSEYITDPFTVGNKYFFETILKPYLINTDVTEKKKKFNLFRKKR